VACRLAFSISRFTFGFRGLGAGFRVWDLGCGVKRLRCRASGVGGTLPGTLPTFRVWCVSGFEFRVLGFGFRVFGFR